MSSEDESSLPPDTSRRKYQPPGPQKSPDDDAKEDLRNIIVGTYELDPDEHQDFLNYKANMAFKNWKT
ncbi:hypothetical protein GIB67_006789 [Kingdonia uniflora]|uniref:Uncharacterized protein n=1 Tax=Kingdonia uniflora TaxID=39325 RepID=A0A7J7KZY0_9MAGN|nr:hypothetical protein GIB67_006789 [Kingdonia uniflora]